MSRNPRLLKRSFRVRAWAVTSFMWMLGRTTASPFDPCCKMTASFKLRPCHDVADKRNPAYEDMAVENLWHRRFRGIWPNDPGQSQISNRRDRAWTLIRLAWAD